MILLLDAGNSGCKWVAATRGEWTARGRVDYADTDLPAVFAAAWSGLGTVERVVVANVAGKAFGTALRDWVKQTWSVDAEFMTSRRRLLGVTNAYKHPQRLGADRWAAMLAARTLLSGAVCIIDCGTAITIDAVNAKGVHKGGLILPGLTLMRRSLVDNTQGIPADALAESGEGSFSILATDTQGAVAGAALYAAVAFIERVSADLGAELREPMTRILTGGDAPTLLSLLNGEYRHEPDLVLQGVARFAESRK